MHEAHWLDTGAVRASLAALTKTRDADAAMAIYDRWLAVKAAVRELDQQFTAAMRDGITE